LVTVVGAERRQIVDRRRGAERRSTLDRRGRGRPARGFGTERPAEHVRNALQLLRNVNVLGELSPGPTEDLTTAIDRLYRAVALLEHHRG
jgi:hypothetical protein